MLRVLDGTAKAFMGGAIIVGIVVTILLLVPFVFPILSEQTIITYQDRFVVIVVVWIFIALFLVVGLLERHQSHTLLLEEEEIPDVYSTAP